MSTLLVQKGLYAPEEFEFQFRQFAQKNLSQRPRLGGLLLTSFQFGM